MLIGKDKSKDDPREQILSAMKNAFDQYGRAALGWDNVYVNSDDVDLGSVQIDGEKEPKRIVETAENWNRMIDDDAEANFRKIINLYQEHPEEGFTGAIHKAAQLPLGDPNHVLEYTLAKQMYSVADLVDYGTDYGVQMNDCSSLDARIDEKSLELVQKNPEDYFTAIITIRGV